MYAMLNLPGSQHFDYYGPACAEECEQWIKGRLAAEPFPQNLRPTRVVSNREAERLRYRDGSHVIREMDR